jgi:hypothetical protein
VQPGGAVCTMSHPKAFCSGHRVLRGADGLALAQVNGGRGGGVEAAPTCSVSAENSEEKVGL